MKLPPVAIQLVDLPENEQILLEEYKLIVAERRFIMTRYMQSLIFYPVVMGYAFKELLSAPSLRASVLFSLFMIGVNSVYWYAANRFRSMAYHALDREMILAKHLHTQLPHPMIWGYHAGVSAFTFTFILVGVILLGKTLHVLPPMGGGPISFGLSF